MRLFPRSGFGRGVVLGAVIGAGGLAILLGISGDLRPGRSLPDEALEVIEANYWREPDPQELERDSVRAMVQQLREETGDRFSHYFDPKTLRRFDASTAGEFSGVGMTVNEVARGLRVAMVFDGAPAAEAGITKGEVITEVNGRSIAGVSAQLAANRIKGPPGTEVTLTVLDADREDEREVEVERAEVRIPATVGKIRTVDGVKLGHLAFFNFSSGAHAELRDAAERLYRKGAEGLVLDLRGNGGGLLNEAVLSTSVFLDSGVIVTTRGRTQPMQEHKAVGDALEPRPMVVLVDGDSASAAEIMAAALESHDVAQLVGERTFGKGTFQEVIRLESGGALDLTIGEFVVPGAGSLAGRGLVPETKSVDDPETEKRDEGLNGALDALAAQVVGSKQLE